MPYTDDQAAQAVLDVIGNSRWEAVGIAHGFIALRNGATKEEAARAIFRHGSQSLKKSREVVEDYAKSGYVAQRSTNAPGGKRSGCGCCSEIIPWQGYGRALFGAAR